MLGSLKEIFPVEAFAPLLGGLLLWFGLNYIFLAPNVIVPRLSERYYAPACIKSVEAGRAAFDETAKKEEADYNRYLNKWIAEQTANAQAQVGNMLGQILGGRGIESQRFFETHGNALTDFSKRMGGQAMGPLQQKAQAAFTEWKSKKQTEIASMRAQQKYRDAAGFCGCNISAAMSNNIDLALYTSTLRMFKPKGVIDLENGRVFEAECGKAPVV
ncbi:hypothetical protein Q9314_28690 (plasmid) [Shinella sumterensis]|nr:hypothetical protein Q9314_28690 [Shinella sumterensis]